MVDVIALIKEVGREEGHQEGIEQGIRRGREEGERQKAIATAQNLLEMGLSIEQIAKATGFTGYPKDKRVRYTLVSEPF